MVHGAASRAHNDGEAGGKGYREGGDVAQEIHFVQKLMESDEEQGNQQFKKVISVLKTNVEKMYNNVKYYQIDLSELFGFLNK